MRISTAALILFWVTSFNIPYWSSANVQSSLPIESSEHSCYYKYDKAGHLLSVEYALNSDKNEYYSYDASGNITEKRIGSSIVKYEYDASNQLKRASSKEGIREYFYDDAGRIVRETLNGATDVEYRYGYLDKVTEVIRNGKSVKFAYDGFGLLTEKRFEDGSVEKWVWDGIALVRRGSDIYVNEPHVSGGVPIISKTSEGVRCHEHDFLGTTLWSTDLKGNLAKNYSDTTIFGVGSIQKDVSARFTGKPYDSDLQAYVFPYRNYDASLARWRSSDPAGYPDGINQHFYAAVPTYELDLLGFWKLSVIVVAYSPASDQVIPDGQSTASVNVEVPLVRFLIQREKGDGTGEKTFHVTGKVNFNNGTWKEVSHDFTVLEGIVSTQFDTPNLGSKSYELAAGKYTGSVTLSAPGLKSDSGNFTINVVEK